MILARATWAEVEALDREQVVVVPIGGTEQQGPSLPMGCSTFIASAIATGLHAELRDDVLIVPECHYGVSGAGKAFAGTIDLGYEALVATLRAIVHSMTRHRFRRFLFIIGGLADTSAAVSVAGRALKDELPKVQFATWEVSPCHHPLSFFQDRGSLLLAAHPNLVRTVGDACFMDLDQDDNEQWARRFVTDIDELSPSGWPAIKIEGEDQARAYLNSHVHAAGALIRQMREGRIYVERVTEG